MAFRSFNVSQGPIKAAKNMQMDKIEIVFVPNTHRALGFLTINDIGMSGKQIGKKKYWGLLPEEPTDQDIINIALYGHKYDNHGMNVSFCHVFNQ